MGWGDEIMVSARAQRLWQVHRKRVLVVDRNGRARRHAVWDGSPYITSDARDDHVVLEDGPMLRPYIDYARMESEFRGVFGPDAAYTTKVRDVRLPWRYTDWRVPGPGNLWWPDLHIIKHGCVVVEPHVKDAASPNKAWPWDHWERLIELRPDVPWMQLGPAGSRILRGVTHKQTRTFQDAAGWLRRASAAVLPEGGLHHTAAAYNVPSVVIFGGMTSPANTGYDDHVNLFVESDRSPCGQRVTCPHCAEAMDSITPEIVAENLDDLLNKPGGH